MIDPKKIPLARVKEAFKLSSNDVDRLITEIWPQNVFPWEIWHRAYDTFWRGVAASNAEMFKLKNPPYPEMTGGRADAHVTAWRSKMYAFFGELAFALPASSVQKGLDYILEETYGENNTVFLAERENLFTKLTEAENGFNWHQFYSIDAEKLDAMLNVKAFGISTSSYHFISQIFFDTMVVDKLAAVRYLLIGECPFDHDVKGLTRHFVDWVKAALAAEMPIIFPPALQNNTPSLSQENTIASVQEAVPGVLATEGQSQKHTIVIAVPASLWEGKPDAAVRDAMKAEYPLAVIASVLLNWCGAHKTQADRKTPPGRKTHIGRLLSGKIYKDDKSYRNFMDSLLAEADSYTIIKA